MSNITTLTAEQSGILRNLETAVESFNTTRIIDVSSSVTLVNQIMEIKQRLWKAFPIITDKLEQSFDSEDPSNEIKHPLIDDGYEEIIYKIMESMVALREPVKFGSLYSFMRNMKIDLHDIKPYLYNSN